MKIARAVCALIPIALFTMGTLTARAEVSRIAVMSRSDVANGKAWGQSGPYERIIGKVYFTVDPKNPYNKNIANINNAPRDPKGMVEYSADIYILAPKNQSKGNGVAFFEVPNRGGQALIDFFSAGDEEGEFGDGSLLNSGYTMVWVGWQFSVDRNGSDIGIDLPMAIEDGKPVTGRVTAPFTVNAASVNIGLDPDTARYPPVDLNSPDSTLSVVQNVYDIPRVIARDQWQFGEMVGGKPVQDAAALLLKEGFRAGQTYLLSYTAKDAPVGGLGFSALRDVASAFRKPGALVTAKYEYVFGLSQSGRFLREFLYEGFNADEQGHKVFDAVWAHIAGAARADFTQPFSLTNGLQLYTASLFPYSDSPQSDPLTGKTDGLLMHMSKGVVPKIIYTNGDCEYWGGGRSAGMMAATLDAKKDLPVPDNVRIYFLASSQHVPTGFPPAAGLATQERPNPNNYVWALRAILVSLDQWVRKGVEPPPSRYPKLSDGTLVPQQALKFPAIPGVRSPLIISGGYRADLGGPQKAPKLPFLVPNVDVDGNDTGGIRLPDIAVPLATYTGWNFRGPAIGAPTELLPLNGSFLPFAATRSQRENNKDPRLSIEERYASRAAYLSKVREAAQKLVQERYLLSQDVNAVVANAGVVWDTLNAGPPR